MKPLDNHEWIDGNELVELANGFDEDCYFVGFAGIVPVDFWPALKNSDGNYGVYNFKPWWLSVFFTPFIIITFLPMLSVEFCKKDTIISGDYHCGELACLRFYVDVYKGEPK